ncbi:Hypothetical_protein [Hexamita inflata]|uniref:Hypothetical_protein n=1 Tax=Hexamita inflata TaxID=28002 RepID=A0AA86NBE3_9EUKA|nr:Hypothetical protein HINF_LOCUS3913 [Hexamita inflata]
MGAKEELASSLKIIKMWKIQSLTLGPLNKILITQLRMVESNHLARIYIFCVKLLSKVTFCIYCVQFLAGGARTPYLLVGASQLHNDITNGYYLGNQNTRLQLTVGQDEQFNTFILNYNVAEGQSYLGGIYFQCGLEVGYYC